MTIANIHGYQHNKTESLLYVSYMCIGNGDAFGAFITKGRSRFRSVTERHRSVKLSHV
jgi:hypothetical protein